MYNKPELVNVSTADELILGTDFVQLADSTGEVEPIDEVTRHDPEE